jgi:hypothetical protein
MTSTLGFGDPMDFFFFCKTVFSIVAVLYQHISNENECSSLLFLSSVGDKSVDMKLGIQAIIILFPLVQVLLK